MDKKIISYILGLVITLGIGHAYVATAEDSIISTAAGLAVMPAAALYALFGFFNWKEFKKKAYVNLMLHVATYLLVTGSFLVHAVFVAEFVNGQLIFEEGWYGVLISMPLFWGIGLISHTLYAWSKRGFEDVCLD